MTDSVTFALVVFGVFVVTNALNFVLIAIQQRVLTTGGRFVRQVARSCSCRCCRGSSRPASLAAILAVAYTNLGYPALVGSSS